MKHKNVVPIGKSELKKLATPRLLKYLQRLQQCEFNPGRSDLTSSEIAAKTGKIYFKSSQEWKLQYSLVKSVLETRSHQERM